MSLFLKTSVLSALATAIAIGSAWATDVDDKVMFEFGMTYGDGNATIETETLSNLNLILPIMPDTREDRRRWIMTPCLSVCLEEYLFVGFKAELSEYAGEIANFKNSEGLFFGVRQKQSDKTELSLRGKWTRLQPGQSANPYTITTTGLIASQHSSFTESSINQFAGIGTLSTDTIDLFSAEILLFQNIGKPGVLAVKGAQPFVLGGMTLNYSPPIYLELSSEFPTLSARIGIPNPRNPNAATAKLLEATISATFIAGGGLSFEVGENTDLALEYQYRRSNIGPSEKGIKLRDNSLGLRLSKSF